MVKHRFTAEQLDVLLLCAYNAEYLLMSFPEPDDYHKLSMPEQAEKAMELQYNTEERLYKIIPKFPPMTRDVVYKFLESLPEGSEPFVHFSE